jgi:hypothetical protein
MTRDDVPPDGKTARSRTLPWAIILVSTLVLTARAWRVQAGAAGYGLSRLTIYVSDVFELWLRGSRVVLLVGAAASVLPIRAGGRRLERLGWAGALWCTFIACVPPREVNFWAAGATSDDILVYFPTGILAVVIAWILSRRPVGWLQFWLGLTIVSAIGAGLFTIQGGFGVGEVFIGSALTAAVAGSLALGAAWIRSSQGDPSA